MGPGCRRFESCRLDQKPQGHKTLRFLFCRRLTRACRSFEVRVHFVSATPLCHFVTFPLPGESPVASTKNRKVTRPCGFYFCRRLTLTCRSFEVRVHFVSAAPLCHFVTFPLPGESPVASTKNRKVVRLICTLNTECPVLRVHIRFNIKDPGMFVNLFLIF